MLGLQPKHLGVAARRQGCAHKTRTDECFQAKVVPPLPLHGAAELCGNIGTGDSQRVGREPLDREASVYLRGNLRQGRLLRENGGRSKFWNCLTSYAGSSTADKSQ